MAEASQSAGEEFFSWLMKDEVATRDPFGLLLLLIGLWPSCDLITETFLSGRPIVMVGGLPTGDGLARLKS